jgi:hypothetical protein
MDDIGERMVVDSVVVFVVEEGERAVVDDLRRADDALAGEGMHILDADSAVARAGSRLQ